MRGVLINHGDGYAFVLPEDQARAYFKMQGFTDEDIDKEFERMGYKKRPERDEGKDCKHEWITPELSWTRCRLCGVADLGPQTYCQHEWEDFFKYVKCKKCHTTKVF